MFPVGVATGMNRVGCFKNAGIARLLNKRSAVGLGWVTPTGDALLRRRALRLGLRGRGRL